MPNGKAIYRGPFVHSASLTDLDICVDGSIGVDQDGKIAFVLRDVGDGPQYPPNGEWEQAAITHVRDEGFFFPGFVGTVCAVS
jgi:guanine deaminase